MHDFKFGDPHFLAVPRTVRVDAKDGSFVLRSPEALGPYVRCVGEWIERWAAETPDGPAFAERESVGNWRRLTWRQVREQIGCIAQSLIDLKLKPGAPIVVLSDNSLDHLLLLLAGMHIGRTVCSVSSAYCRLTKDYSKIRGILAALGPGLVYGSDARVYGPPVEGAGLSGTVLVFSLGAGAVQGALEFDSLIKTKESQAVTEAFHGIGPDTEAKYLLTSGSTGQPKVVVNTHRMLCANQQMIAQAWRFLEHEKPVIVDWLPWSHTFGGNHNLNMVLRNGGTLVIDEGRPAPGQVEKSVRNLREMPPTIYFNVPRGLDMLLPFLEADEGFARSFFSRLRGVFYAGAALPQATWERLQELAVRVRGTPVWLTTAWGSTETAPAVTSAHWELERAGNIGLPLPGIELKFVTSGEKLEMRVRGVSVFDGYRGAPQLTAEAFDAEGYYCIGDAGFLQDDSQPELGVMFNGRVAEDFKLTTGTWVSVGPLRLRMVSALSPWAQDVVITGHDRHEIGMLVFPTQLAAALPVDELADRVAAALKAIKAEGGGSSQTPARALVMGEPPSLESGEITDKGYVNQSAVLRNRHAAVQSLYAGSTGVILPI